MSFLANLFARPGHRTAARSATASRPPSHLPSGLNSQQSPGPAATQNGVRKELLRVVLRDTLNRNGIPTAWIGIDLLVATARGREPTIHARLLIKHWDPRLLVHGPALQEHFQKRVVMLDPLAPTWLQGISWQFALTRGEAAECPPMPPPGIWTASPDAAAPETPPAAEPDLKADARADLERLFAIRDQDLEAHAQVQGAGPQFAATEPAGL
jgi:hypothetical protein